MTDPARQPDPAQDAAVPGRTGRGLRPIDRYLRVPIGFLYLGFIALLAVPVMIWMTLLHAGAGAWNRLGGVARGRVDRRSIDRNGGA